MKLAYILVIVGLVACICVHETDAWWRRRRRRRRRTPPPQDTTAPRFTAPCSGSSSVNYGTQNTLSTVSKFWPNPAAVDDQGSVRTPPVTIRDVSGLQTSYGAGSYTVVYEAKDSSTRKNTALCSVHFTVHVVTCAALSTPANGYHSCSTSLSVTKGTTCTYTCHQGYRLVGNSQRTCNQVGTSIAVAWSGSNPSCQAVTCQALSAPQHGTVSCSNSNRYLSVCTYTCDAGYDITNGQSAQLTCTDNGWTANALSRCEDITSPEFQNCPSSSPLIYAPATETTATVNWTVPTVTDTSGEAVQVSFDGHQRGSTLSEGVYSFTYTALDNAGNTETCSFTKTVQVIRCLAVSVQPGMIVSCSHNNLRGSVCTFGCNDGYRLDGADSATCTKVNSEGSWTNSIPVCNELHCPSISAPVNAQFRNGPCQTVYGTHCYFDCLPGFTTTRNYLRCVTNSGEDTAYWEGPACEEETCDQPVLTDGLEVTDDNSVCSLTSPVPAGSSCEFGCHDGFRLVGSFVAICTRGEWDELPICEVVTCPSTNIPPPENGGRQGCSDPNGAELHGTVCTLYCDEGYDASEPPPVSRTCENGNWNGGPISCSVVHCQPLPAPSNGFVDNCVKDGVAIADVTQLQEYDTVCQTSCNVGYTALNYASRRCLAESVWDGVHQECVDQTPPVLTCPPDQVLFAGPGQIRAINVLSNWEPIMAHDAGMNITSQLVRINSEVVSGGMQSTLSEGDHLLVYMASDAAGNTRECSFNVEVRVTRCPPLYAPTNGDVTLESGQGSCQSGAVYGSQCAIICDEGYELSEGDSNMFLTTCNRIDGNTMVGTWSDSIPVCNIVQCDIPSITNGFISQCSPLATTFGAQCVFTCDEGFKSSNNETSITRTCQADGTFSGQDLNCDVQITCPAQLSLTHGTVTPIECTASGEVPHGTICSFSCNQGFNQLGPNEVQCTTSGTVGTWNYRPVVFCEDIQAPSFNERCPIQYSATAERGTTHAIVDIEEPTAIDNAGSVTIQLTEGLQPVNNMFPEGTTQLEYSAIDSSSHRSICIITISVTVFRCQLLTPPTSGSVVDCSDPVYGSQCSFTCNEGYRLSGSSSRTCELTNGDEPAYWTGSQPTCEAITCPALDAPDIAIKDGCYQDSPGVEVYGTECHFYCPRGYVGVGKNHSRCQADGSWTSFTFSCEAVSCPALVPSEGVVSTPHQCASDPRFLQTCVTSCSDTGFQVYPQEFQEVRCEWNGQWIPGNLANVTCEDTEDPVFTSCPQDFTVYPPRGEIQASITWIVSATDNDDEDPTVTCDHTMGPFGEGDYDVECEAADASGNKRTCSFQFDVTVRRCPQFQLPNRGELVGTCDTIWGSECLVTCSSGYRLDGSSNATCEFDGSRVYWKKDVEPVCQIIQCDPLDLPPDVSANPVFCASSQNVSRGTTCTPRCTKERTLEGDSSSIMCGSDGQWSRFVNRTSDIRCLDKLAPNITSCPAPITVIRTEIWGVEVTFPVPTAIDNVDDDLEVITSPNNLSLPYSLTEDTVFTYTFIDDAGNNETCQIHIHVQDEIAPILVNCPSNITREVSEQSTTVTWNPPQFYDDNGDELIITHNYENGSAELQIGDHIVNYYAINRNNGKSTVCSFAIQLTRVPCTDLDSPLNGALTCYGSTRDMVTVCSISCNSQYDIPRTASVPEFYLCGISGLWNPNAFVPDCSNPRRGRRANLPSALQYHTVTCGTDENNAEIATAFLQLFSQSSYHSSLCSESDQCTVENVQVTCGPQSARRKRDLAGNHAHNLDRPRRSSDDDVTVTVEFEMVANMDNDPGMSDYNATMAMKSKLINFLEEMVVTGSFAMNVSMGGAPMEFINTSLTCGSVAVTCDAGFTVGNNSFSCVPCVRGTYFHSSTSECTQCIKGTYQNETGQIRCKQCPDGQSTVGTGAKTITDCIGPKCLHHAIF